MRIVIVEDNVSVAKGIAYRLRDEGHAVDLIHDGAEADAFLRDDGGDLVILDIKLPGMSGLDVLRAMRKRGDMRPVLMLTAQSELEEKVAGLDAGADDYLPKPFELAELSARVRALARRGPTTDPGLLRLGPLRFDPVARAVMGPSGDLSIPRREVALFETLLGARGRFVSKQALLDSLYGTGADVEDSVVEVYVSRLRKRLRSSGIEITVRRGIGYAMGETGR
ncbi:response regulator transcription factor [Pontivivens ytuae]|uniref:Response regulator transcription factor n=1 Tax=Pontivivens ytuae TaxID=2789856 RepID=A0A7S9LRC7_9RHOB|nr:response regulator transcription factor [Pontivivens ytuae]QPH53325.1 response regulator transcription factor [Pontivivens ytuae]